VSTQELDLAVVGSQIVGLVPLKSMLQTAEYFMEKEKLFLLEEDQKIRLVSLSLDANLKLVRRVFHSARAFCAFCSVICFAHSVHVQMCIYVLYLCTNNGCS